MNIALVFPRTKYPSGDIPLGVAYLASYIRKNIHRDYVSYLKKTFSQEKFDLVGISAMTTMIESAYLTAAIAKNYNPKVKVLLGGPHASVMSEESIKNKYIDAIAIGEGEETFLGFVRNMDNLSNAPGIHYKKDGSVIKNPPGMIIEDLEKIPYPAWDLLEMEEYGRSWFQLDSIADIRGTSIISSRGCPYQCSYCQPTLNIMFGKHIRKRPPADIVGELKALKYGYSMQGFNFVDDTFIVDKNWVKSVCEEIIKERKKYGISHSSQSFGHWHWVHWPSTSYWKDWR